MFGVTPLSPAYGRDYKFKAEVVADFDAGKDFSTPFKGYINKAQVVELGLPRVEVRYAKQRKSCIVEVKP